ncbi:MAG: sigma 54-interacting transcriptional regulator [Planctomycetota bacterium]|nr:sigma 54-interacting transcriptional regulator [Planctomycetota bacterium]
MLAYLIIREGTKWTDVYRLVPGQAVTIGRAPTNHVVVKDERCSRNHAEIFLSGDHWIVRDLDSRNGTFVDGDRMEEDFTLKPEDVIRIGGFQMKYVHDVSKAFPESSGPPAKAGPHADTLKGGDLANDSESIFANDFPPQITHRTYKTKYLTPHDNDEDSGVSTGRVATVLCRLGFQLARAEDLPQLADVALTGVFNETHVNAGALLLLPRDILIERPSGDDLEVFAAKTTPDETYHRVSDFLATTVMCEGEAILARNVMDDSVLGGRDSQGDIYASSVICAPIRRDDRVLGLIHLYSTTEDLVPDPDDLEFTLTVAENVGVALENLSQRATLANNLSHIQVENIQLRERLAVESEIIGDSPAMRKVEREIANVAPSRTTVLICGESGVGKELVARALHYSSPRRKRPFVCLNCAALSESLLESELFGHEKGAFTGATDRKVGKFEAANTGTLMLDEIGEMSPSIQAKFLRVLEGHPFERVGGSEQVTADVRVIAATNRDLEKEVAEGVFRSDLYYRLAVVEIDVPAMRKRPGDILLLADHFLRKFNEEIGRRLRGYTQEALDTLMQYRWPGNVRELKNVVESAVVRARGDYIDLEDLRLSKLATAGDSEHELDKPEEYEPRSIADVERIHILSTLRATGWNKSRAAGILGIERSTLDRKIRRYELTEHQSAPR